MSQNPRISVVTPSFNQGRFLARTLASVASQSYPPHEHLVFDGGSTDETLDVLAAAGPEVSWVSRQDGGQADAVNQGLQAAEGDVIAWLNSDDVHYPDAYQQVAEAFAADLELDVLYGDADHIDVEDQLFEPYPTMDWAPQQLRDTCFLCQPAVFFRRRVIERIGLLDAELRYCMDYNYWLRLADAGCRFAHLPVKLAGSRLYAENKTLGEREAVHCEIAEMFLALDGVVPMRWVWAHAHVRVRERVDRATHPRVFGWGLTVQILRDEWRWNRRFGLRSLLELRRAARVQAAAASKTSA